jgi:hypothetical protein
LCLPLWRRQILQSKQTVKAQARDGNSASAEAQKICLLSQCKLHIAIVARLTGRGLRLLSFLAFVDLSSPQRL